MADQQAYNWTYDRSEFDSSGDMYSTFSIGLYQWLPKASGKGFKKSKTIRVKGYVADPESAYQKADELVHRLNKENVMLDSRPAWVKNQFSVPRPADLPATPKEETGLLDAAKFRRVRIRVIKDLLAPLGYDVSSSVAAKRSEPDYMSIIEFQAGQSSPRYTVNVGYHFQCIAGLGAVHPQRTGIFDYACDYILNTRINRLLGTKDQWFDYCATPESAERQLRDQIQTCLAAVDALASTFPSPAIFVEQFSPERLKRAHLSIQLG